MTAAILTTMLSLPAFADAIEEVRQAEIAFARAFAERDKEAFFSWVAPDAVFLSAMATQRGRDQVIARWSRFFDGVPEAPFSWGPERVEITSGGKIGFSMGPIYDTNGEHAGYYSSIWEKQADGSWKVIVDGPGNPPAPLAELAAPEEEGFVDAGGGVKLHYRKIGRGPVTVIAPLDFILAAPLKQFADIATVITYDPRNRGRSSRVSDLKEVSIQHDVRDLEAVRAHFSVEKFVPLGFSYLGKMVALYASRHPERVSRLIQLGPVSHLPVPPAPPRQDASLIPAEVRERWNDLRSGGGIESQPQEACEAFQALLSYVLVGNPRHAARVNRPEVCALENEWPKNVNPHFAAMTPTIQSATLTAEELARVAMPVLTIHGTEDRNAPYTGGRAWSEALPDGRIVAVQGAAHAVWADDPVTTFGAIRHFLRGEWPLDAVRIKP